jgi:hypothetical protein
VRKTPFVVGNKLSTGRPKGSLNKRTIEAKDLLEKAGFCPITALIDGHRIAMECFKNELERIESGRISPMECDAVKYLKIAMDAAADCAGYVYPKLKSVEQTQSNVIPEMTAAEKLEQMRQAVKFLELQVKAQSDEPGKS